MIIVKTFFTITFNNYNLYVTFFSAINLRNYVLFFTFYSELRHNLDTSGWYSIDINEKETTKFSFINLFHKLSSFFNNKSAVLPTALLLFLIYTQIMSQKPCLHTALSLLSYVCTSAMLLLCTNYLNFSS